MPTAIKQIPEEWKVMKISEICQVLSGSTPKTSEKDYWDGDIPWFTPLDLSKISNRYVAQSERLITDHGFKACSAQKIPPRSLIMSSRAPIGYFAINLEEATTNQGCKTFVCSKEVHVDFLYYYLNRYISHVKRLGSGSTFAEVGKKQLESLEIILPPLPEQTKIATILSKVDEEIEKVEQIIEQIEKLKKGLMRKLLTKGVGHKKFKKTELGEIPEEWEVKEFIDFATLQRGFDLPKKSRIEGVHPLVSSNGITDEISEYKIEAPGVVTGRSGTIGKVFYIENDFWPLNTTLYIKDFHGNQEKFVYYAILYFDLNAYHTGTGVPTLNRNVVHGKKIAVPQIDEQKKIVAILEAIDTKLTAYETNKTKLLKLKKGLMADLLSGKVRVTIN